jgi:hypothetical protein
MFRDRVGIVSELFAEFRLSHRTSAQSMRSGEHAVVLADIGAGQLADVGRAIRGGDERQSAQAILGRAYV